jgi:hypothetical protein
MHSHWNQLLHVRAWLDFSVPGSKEREALKAEEVRMAQLYDVMIADLERMSSGSVALYSLPTIEDAAIYHCLPPPVDNHIRECGR